MVEPTRLEVLNELEKNKDLTQPEMLEIMTAFAKERCEKPELLLDDLLSYTIYFEAPLIKE